MKVIFNKLKHYSIGFFMVNCLSLIVVAINYFFKGYGSSNNQIIYIFSLFFIIYFVWVIADVCICLYQKKHIQKELQDEIIIRHIPIKRIFKVKDDDKKWN